MPSNSTTAEGVSVRARARDATSSSSGPLSAPRSFQFAHAREMRLRPAAPPTDRSRFSSRTRARCDVLCEPCEGCGQEGFSSRTRARCDLAAGETRVARLAFQFAHAREMRPLLVQNLDLIYWFQFAHAREMRHVEIGVNATKDGFQFAHAREMRPAARRCAGSRPKRFSSRTRARCDGPGRKRCPLPSRVSVRARARDATPGWARSASAARFSSRTRARCDGLDLRAPLHRGVGVSVRARARDATVLEAQRELAARFQFAHAREMRRLYGGAAIYLGTSFSSRTRARCDPFDAGIGIGPHAFQFAHAREMRPVGLVAAVQSALVSVRARARDATPAQRPPARWSQRFQFAHAREMRPGDAEAGVAAGGFQFAHAREMRRRFEHWGSLRSQVSVRARARDATSPCSRWSPSETGFSSRTRARCDAVSEGCGQSVLAFQFAHAREMRLADGDQQVSALSGFSSRTRARCDAELWQEAHSDWVSVRARARDATLFSRYRRRRARVSVRARARDATQSRRARGVRPRFSSRTRARCDASRRTRCMRCPEFQFAHAREMRRLKELLVGEGFVFQFAHAREMRRGPSAGVWKRRRDCAVQPNDQSNLKSAHGGARKILAY